jgi:hypothetical protein
MTTKSKALLVSGLLIGLGGYYLYKNMGSKSPSEEAVVSEESTTFDTTKVLSNGSVGEEVKSLQKALGGGLVVDGNFGILTEKRLKAITGKTSISIREYNVLYANNKAKK